MEIVKNAVKDTLEYNENAEKILKLGKNAVRPSVEYRKKTLEYRENA